MSTTKDNKEFYLRSSMFTDLGKYQEEAVDLWKNKCHESLKELCLYLMNVTIHRVVVAWAIEGRDVHEYGDFSHINHTTPISEDDIFLTASSMFAEIYRRDPKGFYVGRPVEKRLNVTCRYVSVLVAAILKANGIPCRCRAGWARYLAKDSAWDHWVNEYFDEKSKEWVMFDLDDLYDSDWMQFDLYEQNKIATEYVHFGKNQFYTAAEAWKKYRKNPEFVEGLKYGSDFAKPEHILKYLFLDLFALNHQEVNYTFMPMAFDKPVQELTKNELKELDALADLLSSPDKNFKKLNDLFENTPKYRMLVSPLVGKNNFDNLIKNKSYDV